eukprot:1152342-Pelagomonas_calceolata.AAC.3
MPPRRKRVKTAHPAEHPEDDTLPSTSGRGERRVPRSGPALAEFQLPGGNCIWGQVTRKDKPGYLPGNLNVHSRSGTHLLIFALDANSRQPVHATCARTYSRQLMHANYALLYAFRNHRRLQRAAKELFYGRYLSSLQENCVTWKDTDNMVQTHHASVLCEHKGFSAEAVQEDPIM